ncbi:hypothetical protein VB715_15015 [Crocosphaera sp. UHCC 0190]|uniref:hypothetical protein n=1 Tax=Crocosphaera sp. UHCC 0190 TaxID=3110246 RepID=UPI002B214ECB|nr:hypothetical protein [Crocosphaera sp. UHCC 0190]MEA5511083.1 hypothetical protein [Crocosphaera sp. UHCC 0190]
MSKSTRFPRSPVTLALLVSCLITLILYILRGLGILGFIPGGVILVLMIISVFLGILYGVQMTRRF